MVLIADAQPKQRRIVESPNQLFALLGLAGEGDDQGPNDQIVTRMIPERRIAFDKFHYHGLQLSKLHSIRHTEQ